MSDEARDSNEIMAEASFNSTDRTRITMPSQNLQTGEVVPTELGSVKLIEMIGHGAHGVVWRGEDHLLGRRVAVKFLQPLEVSESAARQRFLDEARAGAAVHHPNLIEIHQAGLSGRTPYLVLQYIDGLTLAQVLRAVGPLHVRFVAVILDETAAAVDELHRHGIIHRDLKPSNILLNDDGHVYVSDLGISARKQDGAPTEAAISGTPAYMAPEQFKGRASPRTDVYALGITVFELLTGELPFRGSLPELRDGHETAPLPAAPLAGRGIDAGLIDVIERACHKHPHFRYKSAADLSRSFAAATPAFDPAKTRIELGMLLTRRAGQSRAAEQALMSSVEGSIASTVARFAELKRSRRAEPAEITPARTTSDSSARDERMDGPVPCVNCGYNLLGLSRHSRCPECGLPIAKSLDASRIIFASNSWVDSLTVGYGLVFVWLGMCVLALLLNSVTGWRRLDWLTRVMFHTYYQPGLGFSRELNDVALGLEAAICQVPLTLGIWLMTRPRTNWRCITQYICRAAAVGVHALAVFIGLTALFHRSMGGWIIVTGYPFDPTAPRRFGLSAILGLLEFALLVLLLWYFGMLMRSAPEPVANRRVRRWAMAALSATAVLTALTNPSMPQWPGAAHGGLLDTLRWIIITKVAALVTLSAWGLFIASLLRTGRLIFQLGDRNSDGRS